MLRAPLPSQSLFRAGCSALLAPFLHYTLGLQPRVFATAWGGSLACCPAHFRAGPVEPRLRSYAPDLPPMRLTSRSTRRCKSPLTPRGSSDKTALCGSSCQPTRQLAALMAFSDCSLPEGARFWVGNELKCNSATSLLAWAHAQGGQRGGVAAFALAFGRQAAARRASRASASATTSGCAMASGGSGSMSLR